MKLVISLLWVIYLVCMQNFQWDLDLVPPTPNPLINTCISQLNSMLPSKQHNSITCYTQSWTFPNLNSTETLGHYLPPKHSIRNVYRQWTKVSRMRPSKWQKRWCSTLWKLYVKTSVYVCVCVCLCMCVCDQGQKPVLVNLQPSNDRCLNFSGWSSQLEAT